MGKSKQAKSAKRRKTLKKYKNVVKNNLRKETRHFFAGAKSGERKVLMPLLQTTMHHLSIKPKEDGSTATETV
jgi:hypothetical protein